MVVARDRYSLAIRATGIALQSNADRLKDSTLASVMVLALFETLSKDNAQSSKIFTKHVNGALSLLALRPTEQFGYPVGRMLFRQIATNIRVDCAQRHVRVPNQLMELFARAAPFCDPDDPLLLVSDLVDGFTDIRAAMQENTGFDPYDLLQWAKRIDERAVSLTSNMPSWWNYDIVYVSRKDSRILSHRYHLYRDHRIAQLWNTIRMMRIRLNEMIHNLAGKIRIDAQGCGPEEDSLDSGCIQLHSSQIIQKMAADICASVPQFVRNSKDALKRSPTRVASGYFLIWPLFTAGASALVPVEVYQYAVDQLKYIGMTSKIPQAFEAAKQLEFRETKEDWSVWLRPISTHFFCHLRHTNIISGSTCFIYFENSDTPRKYQNSSGYVVLQS